MKDYNGVAFGGVFRDYQQAVLDRVDRHLRDGRIHIVAAPGSGKTILGLELIRRIGGPALVLSPSVTIRQQWGERFEEHFLKEKSPAGYLSYDLRSPALITSVTYQALHAAFNRLLSQEAEEGEEEAAPEDFSGFDLMETIRAAGVRTLCLDEAHHLRSEWQRALEGFAAALGRDVTLIALTATPPYDSTPGEWQRYADLCGEIDEENFVPQLVAQKTLCPHQDYIYFNYPTKEEAELVRAYKDKALCCTRGLLESGLIKEALKASGALDPACSAEAAMLENPEAFRALFCLAKECKTAVPKPSLRLVAGGGLPVFSLSQAETAFQFIVDAPALFGETLSEAFQASLAQEGLIQRRKVCLASNEKLDRMLLSSAGKLQSINAILRHEAEALGDSLRMLILTDYIKKDMKKLIGTQDPIVSMGTTPIFESLRRTCGEVRLALLSGGLVVLPAAVDEAVLGMAREENIACVLKPLKNVPYSEAVFSGSNKNKVRVLTKAFQSGLFNVLIGTKSLLGEGWDSPCINSLILASFVGSFMLSNQMRGRAIRTDRNDPGKASNIFHLVTLEPDGGPDELTGNDYETLVRRFACFLAPAYHKNVIESGMDRIDVLKPPYDQAGVADVNAQMLALSKDRAAMVRRWEEALAGCKKPDVVEVVEISPQVRPRRFAAWTAVGLGLVALVFFLFLWGWAGGLLLRLGFVGKILRLALLALTGYGALARLGRLLRYRNGKATVKTMAGALLKALRRQKEVQSPQAALRVWQEENGPVYCSLCGATAHEKRVFSQGLSQLFSAVDDPRYVLVKGVRLLGTRVRLYSHSYACPAAAAGKKEDALRLAKYLGTATGPMEAVYTRGDRGRQALLCCKKRSYLNVLGLRARNKQAVFSDSR